MLKNKENIFSCGLNVLKVKDIVEVNRRGKGLNKIDDGEVPNYKVRNLTNFGVDKEPDFISKNDFIKNKICQIKKGDVLLASTGVGSLGKVDLYYKDCPATVDGHITILRVKSQYDSGYLKSFLQSRYGQIMIEQNTLGSTGQTEIYPKDIGEFLIPIPSLEIQKHIGNRIRRAEELREEAKQIRQEVDNKFYNLIGINNDYNLVEEKYRWVDNDKLTLDNLIPDSYKGKYSTTKNIIKKFKMKSLNEISNKIFDPPHTAPEFVDKSSYKMIMIENITLKGIEGEFRSISEECHYNVFKNSHLDGSELLVSRVGNSSGTFGSVSEEHKGLNVSGNISIIKIDETKIDKDYLLCYFNSSLGQMYIKQNISNTARKFLTIGKIRDFNVPIVSTDIQKDIGDRIRKYNEIMFCVDKLIKQAKQDVEDLIEGNIDMSKINEMN
jgi:restriction endonuclease S subunit